MSDAEEAEKTIEGAPGVAEVGAVPVDAHLQPELELDPEDMKETIEESGQAQAAVAEPGSELSSEVVLTHARTNQRFLIKINKTLRRVD